MPIDLPVPAVRHALIDHNPRFRDYPRYRIGDDGSAWTRVRPGSRAWPPRFGPWKRLKPSRAKNGYLWVKVGGPRPQRLHRLVLAAFVGPCPPGMECRHLDGRRDDNRLTNLAWGTRAENQADSVRHGTAYLLRRGRKGEQNSNAKLTDAQVALIRATTEPGSRDSGMKAQARRFGVSRQLIGLIVGGDYRPSPSMERSAA